MVTFFKIILNNNLQPAWSLLDDTFSRKSVYYSSYYHLISYEIRLLSSWTFSFPFLDPWSLSWVTVSIYVTNNISRLPVCYNEIQGKQSSREKIYKKECSETARQTAAKDKARILIIKEGSFFKKNKLMQLRSNFRRSYIRQKRTKTGIVNIFTKQWNSTRTNW